ncbi:MAG: hypothetical protein CM1200mP2_55270 [Planctomycetaceae bacterium]|nr:MAG: hypothetical protein CM1200mP2_55270 [Planctomycetaceae bacterium]
MQVTRGLSGRLLAGLFWLDSSLEPAVPMGRSENGLTSFSWSVTI